MSECNYREMVVWGFYGEKIPEYFQGSNGEHEMCEPVTAKDLNKMVELIESQIEKLAEQEELIEKLHSELKNDVPEKGNRKMTIWYRIILVSDKPPIKGKPYGIEQTDGSWIYNTIDIDGVPIVYKDLVHAKETAVRLVKETPEIKQAFVITETYQYDTAQSLKFHPGYAR